MVSFGRFLGINHGVGFSFESIILTIPSGDITRHHIDI